MAIQSFACVVTEQFFVTGKVDRKAGWVTVSKIARRKLDMLQYAAQPSDLKVPPGNRLEELKGNLEGHYSIRINDQWRVIFRWTEAGPAAVSITDYH